MKNSTKTIYEIASAKQIELLASPIRQEILDSLIALGPSTVHELARALGVPADSLYFHLKKLVAAGLVLEQGQRPTLRRAAVVYSLPADEMRLVYDLTHAEARDRIGRVVAAALRSAGRDFGAALSSTGAVPEGRRRNLWGARMKAWLSDDERTRLNQLLDELAELFRTARPGEGQLCTFTWALAPVEAMPVRRGGTRIEDPAIQADT